MATQLLGGLFRINQAAGRLVIVGQDASVTTLQSMQRRACANCARQRKLRTLRRRPEKSIVQSAKGK